MSAYAGLSRGEESWSAKREKRPYLYLLAGGAILFLGGLFFRSNGQPTPTYALDGISSIPARIGSMGKKSTECNPFTAPGRLLVDTVTPTNNLWKPYSPECVGSSFLKALYRGENDSGPLIPVAGGENMTREYLPWLKDRTVVIHGDSIDRFHLKDFCELVKGRLFLVSTDHPASPPSYHLPHIPEMDAAGSETARSKQQKELRESYEQVWNNRPTGGQELTNPWVCDVEEYGFTMINVFTFGLEGAENFFGSERWYHGPATYAERLDEITIPLLKNLAKYLKRPQIVNPDLIEVNSGLWDLRRFTEEDFTAKGFSRPYPEDSNIPYQMISAEREVAWEKQMRKGMKLVARRFVGPNGKARSGPVMLWRTLHHPPRHNYAPYNRVFALDSLARKVLADLRRESAPSYRSTSTWHRILLEEEVEGEDLGLDERLRVDEWGALMLGQEHHFRDLLHPNKVPGSYLWGDILLYELKRAVTRTGRSRSD